MGPRGLIVCKIIAVQPGFLFTFYLEFGISIIGCFHEIASLCSFEFDVSGLTNLPLLSE